MRKYLAGIALTITSVVVALQFLASDKPNDSVSTTSTEVSTPAEVSRTSIVFIGHAYPLNGFDKSKLRHYLGWIPGTIPIKTWGGAPIGQRLENNSDLNFLKQSFYDPLADLKPDRWVWGGDSICVQNELTSPHFLDLVSSYQDIPQVFIPGNHDWKLLAYEKGLSPPFHKVPGGEERLSGMRILYINTVSDNGSLMSPDNPHSAPNEAWIKTFQERIRSHSDEPGLMIIMHHAPWFISRSQANVTHKESPWWNQMHPILQSQAEAGQQVIVLSGDGGRVCMADGQVTNGVRYCVTGQPTYDGDIPNGFLRVTWGPDCSKVEFEAYTWTPAKGMTSHKGLEFPWRL